MHVYQYLVVYVIQLSQFTISQHDNKRNKDKLMKRNFITYKKNQYQILSYKISISITLFIQTIDEYIFNYNH